MGVSCGGLHLKYTVVNVQEGHIEGSTTKVEDKDVLFLRGASVQAVGNGRRSGFVDNTLHFQTSDGAGVLCGLALCVVEVRRHGHDGVVHWLSQERLGDFFHLAQNHGAHFLRRQHFLLGSSCHFHVRLVASAGDHLEWKQLGIFLDRWVRMFATNQSFDVKYGVFWISDGLVLGCFSNKALTISAECNVGWSDTIALFIGTNLNTTIFPNSNATCSCS
mmetsp:Transcript_38990/g.67469  ORF Transcript_38990/g.67469 Transcript_38990/m.67469 type:complete len:219 (+) Transcript_38990:288-944(+)